MRKRVAALVWLRSVQRRRQGSRNRNSIYDLSLFMLISFLESTLRRTVPVEDLFGGLLSLALKRKTGIAIAFRTFHRNRAPDLIERTRWKHRLATSFSDVGRAFLHDLWRWGNFSRRSDIARSLMKMPSVRTADEDPAPGTVSCVSSGHCIDCRYELRENLRLPFL